jgi:hypothetical protein
LTERFGQNLNGTKVEQYVGTASLRTGDQLRLRTVRSTMKTNLKVMLAALGIAILASPVMASSAPNAHNAHGSVARANTAPVVEGNQIRIDDAVHVAFPQQGAGG